MPRIKGTWRPLMMTLKGNVAVVRRGSVGHRMSAGQCGPGHARLGIALLLVGGLTLPLVLQVGVEGKRPINVTIKGVTIRNGNARAENSTDMSCDAQGEKGGGGICVAGAILTLDQSTVEGNGAIFGGGSLLGWGGTLHL